MGKRDNRVDAYIAKQQEFARPILEDVRAMIHEGCPEVEETIKWGAPAFMYRGLMVGLAGFKKHVGVNFWKGSLIVARSSKSLDAAGQFGRITSTRDLPSRSVMLGYVKQAMKLNEQGATVPRQPKARRGAITVPADLEAALAKNSKARATFDAFSPSHKREYLEWITEAKRDQTRQRRLAQAVEWMSKGKPRMWRYVR